MSALNGNSVATASDALWRPMPVREALSFAPPRPTGVDAAVDQGNARYGVHIGGLRLLLGAKAVCEVVPTPVVARLPRTPAWLRGIMNLRGALIPVFDLHRLLGFEPLHAPPAAVVFDRGEQAAAILVEGTPSLHKGLEAIEEVPPLPATFRAQVTRVFRHETDIWVEIDHRALFTALAAQLTL